MMVVPPKPPVKRYELDWPTELAHLFQALTKLVRVITTKIEKETEK